MSLIRRLQASVQRRSEAIGHSFLLNQFESFARAVSASFRLKPPIFYLPRLQSCRAEHFGRVLLILLLIYSYESTTSGKWGFSM